MDYAFAKESLTILLGWIDERFPNNCSTKDIVVKQINLAKATSADRAIFSALT